MERAYHRDFSRNYYHRKRKEYFDLLGGKCNNCGTVERLEFDHIDPETRYFKLGKLLNHSKEAALEELKKCQVLCRPCHTEKSSKEGSFKKNKNGGRRGGRKSALKAELS